MLALPVFKDTVQNSIINLFMTGTLLGTHMHQTTHITLTRTYTHTLLELCNTWVAVCFYCFHGQLIFHVWFNFISVSWCPFHKEQTVEKQRHTYELPLSSPVFWASPSLSSHFTLYLISSFQTTLGEHSKHNYYGAEFINYAAVPFHSKCSL